MMNQDFNPILFAFLLEFTLAVPGVFAQAAAGTPVPLPEEPASGAPEAQPRRVPVDPAVDAFYKLGPDSMSMDGVPKGKFTEAKVLPSQVFPGTQHYDYAWGINSHGQKQGGTIFPEMMRWLWRDRTVSTDPEDKVKRSPRAPATAATAPR